ncbi:HNH endonuclease [Arthrobacter sp. PAMC 25486]|uniref:HNH endonuclease n=1 Tax=Arthrobacter sp. PAMC 25486 TaxID=1494608 RepID=UPI00138E021B|nr:HNH endonuclease [Arthrobacter sp. PAMC 25486]
MDAIEGLRWHQNRCAAFAARLIERLRSAVALEGSILSLDLWQQNNSLSGMEAELAAILQIPEGSSSRLMAQATTLVRELPTTMEHLECGELGWEHAVIIAEETTLLRTSGIAAESISAFELLLLGKASRSTLPSFREKARRLRERRYPESIVPRTRRAYADRHMSKSHARDGMSWLSFFAPAPTVEGIWDQCTTTAQAAQGPHEERTLTQLRVDVAAAMLLNQSLADNQIYAPAATPEPAPAASPVPSEAAPTPTNPAASPVASAGDRQESACQESRASEAVDGDRTPSGGVPSGAEIAGAAGTNEPAIQPESSASSTPAFDAESYSIAVDPKTAPGSLPVDIDRREWFYPPWAIPVFHDPDYRDPSFREPDVRNLPDWIPNAKPPILVPLPTEQPGKHPIDSNEVPRACPSSNEAVWPPLPKVLPILLVPALSMIGATDEPAWMQGAGPISMEVARQLMSESSSMYRILVDPVSNEPLNSAPDSYRITKAMRTMLTIRDEYCQFPGCMAKASSTQIDHIKSFESGGNTTFDNLECLCLHHHLIKHFKDDKTRNGQYRANQNPERQRASLRGWVPRMESSGRVSWTSPTGRNYPAAINDRPLMQFPQWLQRLISEALIADSPDASEIGSPCHPEDLHCMSDGTPDDCPEEPIWFRPTNEDESILSQMAVERALQDPTLGLAEAS